MQITYWYGALPNTNTKLLPFLKFWTYTKWVFRLGHPENSWVPVFGNVKLQVYIKCLVTQYVASLILEGLKFKPGSSPFFFLDNSLMGMVTPIIHYTSYKFFLWNDSVKSDCHTF